MKSIEAIKDISSVSNICFNHDVIETLKQCKKQGIKFKMIYGDPDYNVDINYSGKKYTMEWNDYMNWYGELTKLSLECLEDDGHLFMLNYPKQNSHLRVKYLEDESIDIDESIDSKQMLKNGNINEYVWIYNSNVGMSKKRFTTAHRSILHITKSQSAVLNKGNYWMPFKNPGPVAQKMKKKLMSSGLSEQESIKISQEHISKNGRSPYSWIDEIELDSSVMYHDLVKNVSKEKSFHPCQIPTKLVSGLIQSSTVEGDNVFILFGGSGNELLMCNQINRKFTSCEIYKKYYKLIQDTLKNGKLNEKNKLMFRK